MPRLILEEIGPVITSQLAAEMVKRYEITHATARKRIQRAIEHKQVHIIESVNFAHNQSLAYLPSHTGTALLRLRLFDALKSNRSVFRLPLAALAARGGRIPTEMFPSITANPLRHSSKLTATKLKDKLLSMDLLAEVDETIVLSQSVNLRSIDLRSLSYILRAEEAFLRTLVQWCRKQRLLGNQVSLRSSREVPQFGYHQWDMVGPSYLYPFLRVDGPAKNPGYIVADVILGRKLTIEHVEYFVEKCAVLRASQANTPFLGMLLADWFDSDALGIAQKNGLLFTTPANLFGAQFADVIERIRRVSERTDSITDEISMMSEILDDVHRLKLSNELFECVRDQLFECLLQCLCLQQHPGCRWVNKVIFDPSGSVSSRIFGSILENHKLGSFHLVRWKSLAGADTVVYEDEVKHWFASEAPEIAKKIENYIPRKYYFWTPGTFDTEAKSAIDVLNRQNRSLQFVCNDGRYIKSLLSRVDTRVSEIYARWFLVKSEENE